MSDESVILLARHGENLVEPTETVAGSLRISLKIRGGNAAEVPRLCKNSRFWRLYAGSAEHFQPDALFSFIAARDEVFGPYLLIPAV